MKQLRLYTFVNFYLSSIQQGIQSAHVVSDLADEYRGKRNLAAVRLAKWMSHGKTMIVLNGGMACDIANSFEAAETFDRAGAHYPFTAFYEEPGAIHESRRAITAWGIVLPPEVYNAKPVEVFPSFVGFSTFSQDELVPGDPRVWQPGSFEHFICSHLQGKSLAR